MNAGVNPFPNIQNYGKTWEQEVGLSDFFFLEKDLHPGKRMNLYLTDNTTGANFLPRQLADAIPFSSDKLSEIMDKLSINPHSKEAEDMKQTLKTCEEPSEEGEVKICATSLESIVDFAISKLGKNVQSMSTEVGKEETKGQQYTIAPGVKRIGGETSVICHSMSYAYPIFTCHAVKLTTAHVVPLFNDDGRKTTSYAVCHSYTLQWSHGNLAFKVSGAKPGDTVCHFLLEGDILWISGNKST